MGVLTDKVKIYDRTYRGLRGVDFSSDHTQVLPTRFSYLQNMYKDYQSSQGIAVETIAGYRRRFVAPPEIVDGKNIAEIYGIHKLEYTVDGQKRVKVLVHAGTKLWEWANYPKSVNVEMSGTLIVPTATSTIDGIGTFDFTDLEITVAAIVSIKTADGTDITASATVTNGNIQIISSIIAESDVLAIVYYEGVLTSGGAALSTTMNKRKSISYVFGQTLYLLDGKTFYKYDGTTLIPNGNAYLPTVVINKKQGVDEGALKEQYNLNHVLFYHTFIADGQATKFTLSNKITDLFREFNVGIYGVWYQNRVPEYPNYLAYTVNKYERSITFPTPPKLPTEVLKVVYLTTNSYHMPYQELIVDDREKNYLVYQIFNGTEKLYKTGAELITAVEALDSGTNYIGKTIVYGEGINAVTWTRFTRR
jgi:hypothetical protein